MGGRIYGADDRSRVEKLAPLGPAEISRQTGIPVNTVVKWIGSSAKKPRGPKASQPPLARDGERLGSLSVGALVHAAYPTATSTLCGVRFGRAVPNPRGALPTCGECAAAACVFDGLDDSAPPSWRKAWR